MQKSNRIVFLISSSIGGGAQILLANLAEYISKENEIMVFCPSGFLVERLHSIGLEPIVGEVNSKTIKIIRRTVLEWAHGQECIINPFLFGTAYYCCKAFKGDRNCRVFSLLLNPILREDLSFIKRIVYRYIAKIIGKNSYGIGVGSPELLREVKDIMHRTPYYLENRVPNIVPPKMVFYDSQQPLKVCFVGRMAQQKRPDLFVETAKITKKNNANIHYYMAGEGPLKDKVMQSIKNDKLEDTVEMVGFIDNLYDFLLKMDILLSSAEFENTPLIVLNAMNASLPVVTGNVIGVPHLIKNKEDGIVTEEYTAQCFADTLIHLSENPEIVKTMSKAAYQKAITDYSFQKFADSYLNALLN